MTIAYIYLRILPIAGVDKKPVQQAAAIKKLGIKDFDVIVLNPNETKEQDGVKYVKYRTFPKPFHWLDYIFKHNFWRYKIFEKSLDLSKYDYLIIRYPRADRSGIQFSKLHSIITEHHTRDLFEFKLEAQTSKSVIVKLFKYLRYFLENKYGMTILHNSKGNICLSNSIKENLSIRTKKRLNKIVIGNGTNVDSIEFTKYKIFDQKELHIAFVGSSNAPWFGIDRLISGIRNYKGDIDIKLHLIGSFSNHFKKYDFIILHGLLKDKDFDKVMRDQNIACGSLALYLSHGDDASTLKIREYTSRGMPFIISGKDIDLTYSNIDSNFFLEVPNDASPIDFEKVIEFVREINSKYTVDELSSYMREYAKKYMDWTIKMQQYHDFVKKIDEGTP